jgi:hypothetical protein
VNVFVVKSGEVPFREYAFPPSERKAANLLLTVMQRNNRPATMATVSSRVMKAAVANGHIPPEGWSAIAQQAL